MFKCKKAVSVFIVALFLGTMVFCTTPGMKVLAATNLISNPSFSSNMNNWITYVGTANSVNNNYHSASRAARLGTGTSGIVQEVTSGFQTGDTMSFTAWGKVSFTGDLALFVCKCLNSSGDELSSSLAAVNTASYTQKSFSFTVVGGTAKIQVLVYLDTGTGYFYADDLSLTVASSPSTYYIDPSADSNGIGSQTSPYNTWSGITLQAGKTYLQKCGTTYNGSIYVTSSGTSASPIHLSSYGAGNAPVVNGGTDGGIIFDGAKHVTVSGFAITTPDCCLKLYNGSSNITAKYNELRDAAIGIWLGTYATPSGANNLFEGNIIHDMTYHGCAVDKDIPAAPGSENIFRGNTVWSCAFHGFEISSSYNIIEKNTVTYCGYNMPTGGCSGIHLYAGGFDGSSFWTVQNNIIRYNIVCNIVDNSTMYGYDGNGIQLDQKTSYTTVDRNFCFDNDGQGIIVFDSWNNTITGNFCYKNGRNTNNRHVFTSEIVLNESDTGINGNHNNLVRNNTCIAYPWNSAANTALAYFSNSGSLLTNILGLNNLFTASPGINTWRWQYTNGNNAATWNNYSSSDGYDDNFTVFPFVEHNSSLTYNYRFGVDNPAYTVPNITINGINMDIIGWYYDANGSYLGVTYK